MKFPLPLVILAALALCACNTIENRRSLYSIQKVHGPYTRELEEGTWGKPKSVEQEYAETQARKRYPKVIVPEKKPAGIVPSARVPGAYPDPALPQ